MDTRIKVVDDATFQTLKELLSGGAVVILHERIASELGIEDGKQVDWHFGGEPDVNVDLVDDMDHYFAFTYLDDQSPTD